MVAGDGRLSGPTSSCIAIARIIQQTPTGAHLNRRENNFKFSLKLTLERSNMFQFKQNLQGAHYLSLLKL